MENDFMSGLEIMKKEEDKIVKNPTQKRRNRFGMY